MPNEHILKSQVVAGLVLLGRVPAETVSPQILYPPYNDLVAMKADGKSVEEIYDRVGYFHCQEAEQAAKSINGVNADHVKLCEWAAVRARAGDRLEPVINRWKEGRSKEDDLDVLIQVMEEMQRPTNRVVNLGDVEAAPGAWKKTNYEPFDNYFGGIPADSLTVIAGPPGTGKTSICARLMLELSAMREHSVIFSLEMTLQQLKFRMEEIAGKKGISKDRWSRIHAAEKLFEINEITSEVIKFAKETDLGLVIIDFADMVRSSWSKRFDRVGVIDEMYRTFAELASKLEVPVVVLSQLNDQYIGGRPRVNHMRGSRLIEALASMVVLLYNPDQIDVSQKDTALIAEPGIGYLILGKSRYGFGEDIGAPGNWGNSIGAVQVPWEGKEGWGKRGVSWFRLSNT